MNKCKKCRNLFTGALYDELDTGQKLFFERHIELCQKCRLGYAQMESTLKIMDKRTRKEPGKAFWDSYWNRLARKMEKEEALTQRRKSWRPRWSYQAVAAVILVILGFFMGRVLFFPSLPERRQAVHATAPPSQLQPGLDLVHRTRNYIERSKPMLLAIINFDPKSEDLYALDLPYQQQVSRELVNEAGILKKELADSGQKKLQDLITDLELILLQIANLESEHDFDTLELVKRGVDSRGILLKINITDIRKNIDKEIKKKPIEKRRI